MSIKWFRLSTMAVPVAIAGLMLAIAGCNDDDNGTGGTSQRGSMVLMMHDAPIDDMKEAWVTVESVTMIGADDDSASGEVVLSESVRMDLLALDSTSQILAAADVQAGAYNKIRLQISDPEFVRDDDSVFSGDDIHLVANGHVDLNTQGDVFIVGNEVTVVSLDLDVENSVQINQTGNGRYILRPQIFVDTDVSDEEGIIISNATIMSIDLNTNQFTVSTSDTEANIDIVVITTQETDIVTIGGAQLALASLLIGSTVDVVGTIDMDTGVVTATEVQVSL